LRRIRRTPEFLRLLQHRSVVGVSDLVAIMDASEATVRRGIRARGRWAVRRIRGGAEPLRAGNEDGHLTEAPSEADQEVGTQQKRHRRSCCTARPRRRKHHYQRRTDDLRTRRLPHLPSARHPHELTSYRYPIAGHEPYSDLYASGTPHKEQTIVLSLSFRRR
jgi:hypothetical protein